MKLDSVQVGRALAALAVVLFHSRLAITNFAEDYRVNIPYLYEYGFFGVQFFFAISGFIICHISDRPDFNRTDFFVRRFFRIYPLYAVFCFLGYYMYARGQFSLGGSGSDAYSLLTLVKSMAIIPQPGGPIYAVGWSLEHEVIFYLLAGLLIPIGGINLLAVSVLALWVTGKFLTGWNYHLASGMHIYFFAGILVYQCRRFLPFLHWTAKGFVSKVFVRLGDVSFSLYLVHWIVFAYMNYWANFIPAQANPQLVEVWRIAAVAISIACAFVIWFFVERPVIAMAHKLGASAK